MTDSMAAYASLAEVYGTGQYAPFLRAKRVAGTAPIALVRFSQPAGAFPDPPTSDFTLAMNERGTGRMSFDIGLGRRCQTFRHGDLVLKPPAVATYFANDAPHQKGFLSLPALMVHQLAAEMGTPASAGMSDFGPLHEGVFRSSMISRLLEMIWAEAGADSPQGRLFTDGAVLAIVATLQKLALPAKAPARPAAGLSAARLARLRSWVEAHLTESFGLAEMAGSIGLSPYHFSRAFKLATGLTPRAYVMARRIDRTRALLSEGVLPLAQVAQDCGFADQSHFSAAFSRHTGLTPSAYRRSRT